MQTICNKNSIFGVILFVFCRVWHKKGRSKVQKHFIPAYLCVVFFHAARLCRRWDDVLDEILMQMVVGGQFGMESGGELMSLSNRHDMSVHL